MAAEPTFREACSLVEAVLSAGTRRAIVADLSASRNLRQALGRLRNAMRSDVWKFGSIHVALDRVVGPFDARTRRDGFHALHDWDGKADAVNENTIPLDVLNFTADRRGDDPVDPMVLATLIDYHFVYILALLSLRVWDGDDADGNLDRLDGLLALLQSSEGSGQRFADDIETMLLVATSHFELDDGAYDRLLERSRALNRSHRLAMALVHARSLGSHLRFGFDFTYGRDLKNMRDDNGVDYRWLCFSIATLMTEYARRRDENVEMPAASPIVEALANGLSPDARAFVTEEPACLSGCAGDVSVFRDHFARHKDDLLSRFEAHRPSEQRYSPMAFSYNFAQNILKGIVVDALLWGEPWKLSFNDLLTAHPAPPVAAAGQEKLARTLAGYAKSSPDTIRGRLMPVIVYDPSAGRQAFSYMMKVLSA